MITMFSFLSPEVISRMLIFILLGIYFNCMIIICRRWPYNFEDRVEESKETCKEFKEEVAMV